MKPLPEESAYKAVTANTLTVHDLGMAYSNEEAVFSKLNFTAKPGQIIGVTGAVACGKTTLGRAFLCEHPYQGSIRFGKEELSDLSSDKRCGIVGYLGHDPELLSDTIQNNILLGDSEDVTTFLKAVCLDHEVSEMPDGVNTLVGNSGIRLSGGQQARLALARTLAHPRPLFILDDPFSALDQQTECEIFNHLRVLARESIVILISHRLYLFPEMDQIIWMEKGRTSVGTHDELMNTCKSYAELYKMQEGGADFGENK